MRKSLLLILMFAPMLVFGQKFDYNHSNARVMFFFVAEETEGTITDVEAKLTIDFGNIEGSKVEGKASVSKLSTENKKRDDHLKSSDFFDAEKYPTMTFVSSGLRKEGDKYIASGKLTIKDVTKEVDFEVNSRGDDVAFVTTIYTSDFGIFEKKSREETEVRVVVIVEDK